MIERSLCGHSTFFFWFYGLLYAPVSICFVIFNTNPFLISLFAFIILSETIERYEICGMALCFFGIVVLSLKSMIKDAAIVATGGTLTKGMVLVILSASSFSLMITMTRRMKDIKPQVILLLHAILGVFCGIIIVLFLKIVMDQPISLLTLPASTLLKLVLASSLIATGDFCVTAAFQSDSSGFVSMFLYTQVVMAFFVDILLFNETFTFLQVAIAFGILVVCISVAYIKLKKIQKEHPEEISDNLSSRSSGF